MITKFQEHSVELENIQGYSNEIKNIRLSSAARMNRGGNACLRGPLTCISTR